MTKTFMIKEAVITKIDYSLETLFPHDTSAKGRIDMLQFIRIKIRESLRSWYMLINYV